MAILILNSIFFNKIICHSHILSVYYKYMKIVFPIKYIYYNDTEKSADSQQQKKESTACRFHFPVETDIGLLTLKSQRKPTVREIYDLRRVD